ncbi:MAG: hypothetical protein GY717_19920 [Rhodobacteraceae bacterium]|nr:hypothetical protein [Paracoccaceae bacterium]
MRLLRRGYLIESLENRASLIERYFHQFGQDPVDFLELVGEDNWNGYWQRLEGIHQDLRAAQEEAEAMRELIEARVFASARAGG